MEDDSLFDILLATRHTEDAVRLNAIRNLHGYVNSAQGEPLEEPYTRAEEWQAWNRARVERLQQKPINEALLLAIEDSNGDVRFEAANMLGDMEDMDAHEAVVRHLQTDPYAKVRFICSSGLRGSAFIESGQQALITALQDPTELIAADACSNLAAMGCADAIEPLRAMLSHTSWKVRFEACKALVKLQAVDTVVVSVLEQLNLQPQATEHNDVAHSINERKSKNNILGPIHAKTTEEVLEEARNALP